MKKTILLVSVLLLGFATYAQNKNAKATLNVDGVCTMCKSRIEKASIKTIGVKSAVWNVDTHELFIIYDERKTSLETINQNIADVGHDTDTVKATDAVYSSLDPCCLYRDEQVRKDHEN